MVEMIPPADIAVKLKRTVPTTVTRYPAKKYRAGQEEFLKQIDAPAIEAKRRPEQKCGPVEAALFPGLDPLNFGR